MTEPAPISRRTLYIVLGIVSALLIAVIVVGVVLINTLNAQAENQQYRDCMARQGYAADEQPAGMTRDKFDAYLEDMMAAAERCGR
jgi:hypothetical protein